MESPINGKRLHKEGFVFGFLGVFFNTTQNFCLLFLLKEKRRWGEGISENYILVQFVNCVFLSIKLHPGKEIYFKGPGLHGKIPPNWWRKPRTQTEESWGLPAV